MGRVRPFRSIVKSTALEILSEPLTLLILLAGSVLTVLAPVFHYHQFGEPTRMARDAGLSAIFTCCAVLGVFATIRAFRREIETGTAEMALSHPVSREGFFLAKWTGAVLADLFVLLIFFGLAVTGVIGADIGGRLSERTGELATVWGPAVAAGTGTILLPLLLGAILNRFASFRFVLTAISFAFLFALASAVGFSSYASWTWAFRLLVVVVPLVFLTILLVSVAASASVRYKANGAAAVTGLVFAVFLPFIGNYYLADCLSNGQTADLRTVLFSTLAILPAIAAFLVWGVFNEHHRN